jgi:tetratricopeptide (TPR) repeat protein
MNQHFLSTLDHDELFQLGINAGAKGDSANAIIYLKEACSRPDASGKAHYLLGAEYAQIGLFPRAIDAMEAALALDPTLATARLQLGMLWLGANDGARAAEVLQALEELAQDDALRHFGLGLRRLIENDHGGAIAALQEGIARNALQPLSDDMQRIITQLQQTAAAEPAAQTEQHLLLSAYAGNTSH